MDKIINVVNCSQDLQNPAVKASQIMRATRRRFTYGNAENQAKPGLPVEVPQNEYVYTLVVTSKEPLDSPEIESVNMLIQKNPKVTGSSIVRQDFVPFVSDEMYASLDGDLGLRYSSIPNPMTDTQELSAGASNTKTV
jgi:hypothetical protein